MDFSRDLSDFIFDHAVEGIFQSTPQGRYLRVNQAMAKIHGYDSPQDMVNSVTDISRQIHTSPKTMDEFKKVLKERETVEGFEAQNKRKDGSIIWTSTNAKAVCDARGRVQTYVGFVQDITARKQAEHALGETETRYQTLVEQVPAAVYIDAPTDNLNSGIYISPQIQAISGYPASEWTQTRGFWPSIIHPDDLERFTKENTRTNETGEPFDVEYRIIHKNGSIVWLRDMAILTRDVDGSRMYWHGILIDVTEQKYFHDSLLFSEDRFRKFFEASPIAICITTLENGEFIDANESYLHLSGYRREELIGHTTVELGFTSLEERAIWIEQFLAAGESIHRLEAKFKTASGEIRKTLDFFETIEIGGRKAILSMFYDTTAQSKVTEALRENEEQNRMLIEQASDGIFIADLGGKLLEVNPFGCAMLGYTRSELLKKSIFEIMDQEELASRPSSLLKMKIGDARTTERHLIRKDGSRLPVEISAKILPDGRLQGMVRDITERRKASDAQERQFKELSVLHALAIAGTRARDEDELIDQATEIIGYTLYPDILGILLMSDSGDKFYPHASYRGVTLPDLMHEYQIGEGVTGVVAKTGKSMNIPDVREMDNYIEVNPNSRSELCVPMMIGDRVIGLINAESYKIGYFTSDDERLLLTISGQLATAIERLRSEQSEREQRNLAEALRDIAETLNSTLEFNKVLDRILENIGRVVRSQSAMIMLVEHGIARCIRHRGFSEYNLNEWIDALRISCEGVPDFRNAIKTKRPQLIPDTQSDPDWVLFPQTNWIRSHLLAPILIDKTVIGFISLDHNVPGFFTKRDEERILAFTNQAATALENARLFQAEQQRRHEAETLREASGVVATTLDSGLAVELILDQLARVLQYDSAAVQLLQDGYLEIVGGRGWSAETAVLGMRFPVPGDNPNSTVVLEKKPVILNHARDTYSPFREPPHSHIQSWMGVPLIAHGEVIGMLSVDSKEEDHFNEEHIRLVTAFANQAAVAIENARLHEKTEGQIQRLTALRDVDTAIASSLDLRVTLSILLDHAMSQLNADAMDVMVYNSNMQILELAAGAGFLTHTLRRQNRIGEGLAGKIAISRKMLRVHNLADTPEFSKIGWLADEKFISYAGFPLLGKGQIKGVFEAFFRTPHSPNADWLDFMQTLAGQAAIAIDNSQLFENLQRSNQELSLAYDTTLEGWGKALELRDKETQGHTRRVTELTSRLARKMGISDAEITHIRRGVLLHDIGKMGVPDHILRKTGSLDDFEWQQMRLHPQYAFDLLNPISYLRPALDIPYCHHEKWDGTGYPRGLKGTEIPLSARIFSVVDVWDALRSERPYRESWEKEKTLEYIRAEIGTRFDPEVVRIFLEMVFEEK